MASEAQIQANQENAKHSTGPRSPEGKQRVALNALKHGLTGKQVVLYNEKPEDFDAFRGSLWDDLDPHGMLEGVLVDKIVADAWRLRRVPLLEAAMHACIKRERDLNLVRKKFEDLREATIARVKAEAKASEGNTRTVQLPKEEFLAIQAAEKELMTNSDNASFEITRTLKLHAGSFENLSRREEALAKSMLRSLNELERIQRRRGGEALPAPVSVNVDVDVNHNSGDGSLSEAVTAESKPGILAESSANDDFRPKSWSV
jgi:hypothetical protein